MFHPRKRNPCLRASGGLHEDDNAGFSAAVVWLLALHRVRLNARQHASRQGWETTIELLES